MTRHETERGGVPSAVRTYIDLPPHTILWRPLDHADDGQETESTHARRDSEDRLPGERDSA